MDDAKKLLDTSALANRNLFLAFYLLLVSALVLCLSISDEQLLIGNAALKLPLLNVDLPIWACAASTSNPASSAAAKIEAATPA